jgi:hypothetical protein
VAEVDRYRTFKVREGALSSESINKTITRLGQVLAVAEERDLVTRNPVRVNTRNRKLKTPRRRPVYLDSAEQIAALVEAAADLDGRPTARTTGRRGLVATGRRPRQANGSSTFCRCSRTSSRNTAQHRHVLRARTSCSPRRAGLVGTRTTSARASSTRSSPGPTSCSPSIAHSRCRAA